jgi:protein-disulfide isomerase
MKLAPLLAVALFGMTFFMAPAASADDSELVNTFSIDEPNQPDVTPAMVAKSRGLALTHINELIHGGADPTNGSPNATVVLVEFMDFKCAQSERMDPAIQALVAENPSFRVIYKIVPIHGDVSVYAARAALAANKQGKYIAYHKALMLAGKTLTQDKVLAIAQSLGIDMTQLKRDMDSPETKALLEANLKLFHSLSFLGTPDLIFTKFNLPQAYTLRDIVLMMGLFTKDELQVVIDHLL